MKRILFSILLIVYLVGCLSSQGKKFIEDPDTQQDVKELVEETLSKEEVPVKARSSNAIYRPIGKGGKDEAFIRVSYDTINKPVFHNYAFVEVDTKQKPRQLIGVTDSGILHDFEYDLYEVIIAYTFQRAYETSITKLKSIGEGIPHIIYEADTDVLDDRSDPYIELALDKDQLTEEKRQKLLADYAADKFASPTEEEAKSLLDTYLFLQVGIDPRHRTSTEKILLPGIHLHYTYEGIFNNNLMNELLDELRTIEDLPHAFYTINVQADDLEQDNVENTYNKDHDGNYYNEFIGYIHIDEQINEKNNTPIFINKGWDDHD